MRTILMGVAIATIGICAPGGQLLADEAPPLDDRFMVQLGGFLVGTDTTVRIDGGLGNEGTEFNWEGKRIFPE